MKRRDFITLLGGVTVAWPLAARAQQPERMRRIGVLMSTAADHSESKARLAAFLQRLQELGWVDEYTRARLLRVWPTSGWLAPSACSLTANARCRVPPPLRTSSGLHRRALSCGV